MLIQMLELSLTLMMIATLRGHNKALSLLTRQAGLNLTEELSGIHLHMTFFAKEKNHLKQCTLAYGDRGSSTPEKKDDSREGLFARWVVRPIADIVGKRLRELIAENSEKKE